MNQQPARGPPILGITQGDSLSPFLDDLTVETPFMGSRRGPTIVSPTPDPLEIPLIRSRRRVRQRTEQGREMRFPYYGPEHTIRCEHCTMRTRDAIRTETNLENLPTGPGCRCVFLGMNGRPLYNEALVLAPAELTDHCASLFERRCYFSVLINRSNRDPVVISTFQTACSVCHQETAAGLNES